MKVIGTEATATHKVTVIGIGPADTGVSRQLKIGGFMTPNVADLIRTGNKL